MPARAPTEIDAATEAWRLFHRLMLAVRPNFGAIAAEFKLAPQQIMTLRRLEPGQPLPMSAVADALRCDASNVTGIVDRLEERGLLERQPSTQDRRVKNLVLTPAGIELRERINERFDQPPPPIARLSPEDQAALRDLLARALDPGEA